MYCVIQKQKYKAKEEYKNKNRWENRRSKTYACRKELKVTETTWTSNGVKRTSYGYTYSDERFERPILDCYKISIHKSYRENGKVKKKQWVICTMGYYDFLDSWYGDYYRQDKLNTWLREMEITEDEFYEIVNEKIEPLVEQIEEEFKLTEEYAEQQRQREIINTYQKAKAEFKNKYGVDEYDYCYDVFGTLRNTAYLKELEDKRKAQEEYTRRSYEENFKRTYSNYSGGGSSSYSSNLYSTYTDEEKKILHEIYRMVSKKFHPDVSGDDGRKMKFLTKLKEQWGL
ncbi:hypothetical protein ACQKMV_05715 [Lysinibacillus sp. NPDC094403]|uniref:hypothetical protein n=1 Tax=Lysinibacillus sp. NPDC094403 TaxID=3390581 RepID=UPI003CFF72CD